MFERFVAQVLVQQVRPHGLRVEHRVERGAVHVGDQPVPHLAREVEHAAYGRCPVPAVRVEPAGQRVFVGHVDRREDRLRAGGLQLLEEGHGPALCRCRVGLLPGVAVRYGCPAHQDEPSGAALHQRPAQQPAQGAERPGDEIASVRPQAQRQWPGQSFGGPDAAGRPAVAAQPDLFLVVTEELAQECLGVRPDAGCAGLPCGVEVDQFAPMACQLLVPEYARDAPGGRTERFGRLAR